MTAEGPQRVAAVTGGGAGIGKACAMRLARDGAAVVVGDVDERDGQRVVEQIQADGGEAAFVRADVASEADCKALANAALQRWGRIDALIANAGARVYGSILDATDKDWQTIVGVNLRGVANSCRAVLPSMIERKGGAIVIISSANALVPRPDMQLYDATKAAVLSLARSLAVAHGGDGVRVNAVCPGFTITDFHERNAAKQGRSAEQVREQAQGYGLLGRPLEPDEVAAAACFLVGDDARMITGQTLLVDAGMSLRRG